MAKRIPPGRLEKVARDAFNSRAPSTPSGLAWADATAYERAKFKALVDKYDGGKRTIIPPATQSLIEAAIVDELEHGQGQGHGQGMASLRAREVK